MRRPVFVGIETGGTKILCQIVDATGKEVASARFPTGAPDRAAAALIEMIEAAVPDSVYIAGIGIASFGPVLVDPSLPDFGAIKATAKPGWSGFNLVRALADRLQVPVTIDTDVNAAALAEQRMGAGRGCHTVGYVTVGTGIGGGLAIDGRALRGALHPEIGHIPVRRHLDDHQLSACRFHSACAEGLAAGPAVGARLDGRSLETAAEVRLLVADYLGQLAATLLLAWSPQRIVLGGGVMSTPGLIAEIEARMRIELNGYGAAVIAERSGYLIAAELEHAGLEGALLMARAAAGNAVI